MTHYDLLGVDRDADGSTIRRAYLRRARALHPDSNAGMPESETAQRARDLARVNEAWWILKDPGRRADYDRQLVDPPDAPPRTGPAPRPRAGPTGPTAPAAPPPRAEAHDDPPEVSPAAAVILRVVPALLLALVLGVLLIFTAVARTDGDGETDIEPARRCVDVDSTGARRAPCTDSASVIVAEVTRADACPALSVAFASDRAGVLWCVRSDRG